MRIKKYSKKRDFNRTEFERRFFIRDSANEFFSLAAHPHHRIINAAPLIIFPKFSTEIEVEIKKNSIMKENIKIKFPEFQ